MKFRADDVLKIGRKSGSSHCVCTVRVQATRKIDALVAHGQEGGNYLTRSLVIPIFRRDLTIHKPRSYSKSRLLMSHLIIHLQEIRCQQDRDYEINMRYNNVGQDVVYACKTHGLPEP